MGRESTHKELVGVFLGVGGGGVGCVAVIREMEVGVHFVWLFVE